MFGMVLAIGLLVDDAIVVVENVERMMHEEGLSPREATRKSMDEITGALVGIALVLSAVFLPMAFFGGSAGVIYRQFSVTIVSAMALSVLVALVLTPALCATSAEAAAEAAAHVEARLLRLVQPQLRARPREAIERGVRTALRAAPGACMLVYWRIVAVDGAAVRAPAHGFLPDEDQGFIYRPGVRRRPAPRRSAPGRRSTRRAELLPGEGEATSSSVVFTVAGFSFAGAGQNCRPGLRQAEGLERAQAGLAWRVHALAARRHAGTSRQFSDAHGLRHRAAGGAGTGQCHRLRPRAGGSRQSRP